jgi:hypothetical protein
MKRDIGIVVFPEYFQTEGIDRVLDNIQRRAAPTAIATSPYVMRPSDPTSGSREPPIDGGLGTVRLLDRELWGKRELFVQTSVSYEPEKRFYQGLRYQPPEPDAHTRADGATIATALEKARARGLQVNLQIQAAIPPGYRVQFGGPEGDDEPKLFDGSRVTDRLDKNGSLASPHILAYTAALLRDLAAAYPAVDGFHIDWPEYPPYTLDSAFLDFSDHAQAAAASLGFDFDAMRRDTQAFHEWLTKRMTLTELAALGHGAIPVGYPGVADMMRFKARISVDFVRALRKAVPGKRILLRSFPPPWTSLSGFDFAAMAPHADAIAAKLFTMHWPMMVGSWTKRLLRDNPALGTFAQVAIEVARLFDICDSPEQFGPAIAEYPGADANHPVDRAAQLRKIAAARARAGDTPVYAMAHGFGPVQDFDKRLRAAFDAAAGRVWINRYGYLSDEKLDLIGKTAVAG